MFKNNIISQVFSLLFTKNSNNSNNNNNNNNDNDNFDIENQNYIIYDKFNNSIILGIREVAYDDINMLHMMT